MMTDRYGTQERAQARRRLERIAWLMDNSIPLPGLDFRIGLDGLLGLLPGVGDTVGAVVSSYILAEAARLGAPRSVLLKMAFNIGVDAVFGAIPLFGDLFDFTWKANRRNVRLIESFLDRPGKTVAVSRFFVASICFLVLAFVFGVIVVGALLVRWIWLQVTGG
jgi:hypothetical protein